MVFRKKVRNCSECKRSLSLFSTCGLEFHRCPCCEGAWTSHHTLSQMFHEMGTETKVELRPLPHREGHEEELSQRFDALAPTRLCLDCHEPMRAMAIGRVSVDVCADHGVWFDRRELQDVLHQQTETVIPEAPPRTETRPGSIVIIQSIALGATGFGIGWLVGCLTRTPSAEHAYPELGLLGVAAGVVLCILAAVHRIRAVSFTEQTHGFVSSVSHSSAVQGPGLRFL